MSSVSHAVQETGGVADRGGLNLALAHFATFQELNPLPPGQVGCFVAVEASVFPHTLLRFANRVAAVYFLELIRK